MANWDSIMPQEVEKKLNEGEKLNILDVRESDEWASGHIPGAQFMPLGLIPVKLNELDKNKEYVVVCRSGGRSSRACDYLSSYGYRVINMSGGMMSWGGKMDFGN